MVTPPKPSLPVGTIICTWYPALHPMRKLLHLWLLLLFVIGASSADAAVAATAAAKAASTSPASTEAVSLTPQQARAALDVLNDPKRRSQVADTLQAIAAAGALSAPPASAPQAASASSASAPAAAPASGVAAIVPDAFKSNGLASQLARQGAHWAVRFGKSLRGSAAALLDVTSVHAWWNWQSTNPEARATLLRVVGSLLAALIPAFVLEWLARRLLRRAYLALAARRERNELDEQARADLPVDVVPADAPNAAPPLPVSPDAPRATGTSSTDGKAIEAKGKQNARHHWTLLQRLPRALFITVLRLLPLVVFVGAASALMSIFTDNGTPQDRALDSLIDIYVLSPRHRDRLSVSSCSPPRRVCACCA